MNQDKQTVLIYLQSIVAILNQNANFPADIEISCNGTHINEHIQEDTE